MNASPDFPRLTPANHRVTSPATIDYHCIAWAAEDTENWWQPGVFWIPADWPENDFGLGALENVFRSIGYVDCSNNSGLEAAFQKVALYGYGFVYTHAARQLPSGKWTSKLGKGEDIEHDTPDDVAGGVYGEVTQVMKRAVKQPDPRMNDGEN
jgi:hypothetical protein